MKDAENLIEVIDKILVKHKLSKEERATLVHVKGELEKSKTKKQAREAIVPLLKMLHYIKEIIDIFTNSSG